MKKFSRTELYNELLKNSLKDLSDKYHINYFPSEITPNYIESVKNDINNRIYRVKLTIKKV